MRLSDCFIKLIAYVAYLTRFSADRQPAFTRVNTDIQRLVAESEAICSQGGFASGVTSAHNDYVITTVLKVHVWLRHFFFRIH